MTVCPVVPVILPIDALLELATLAAVHEFPEQVKVLKAPFVPHVAIPPPVKPESQLTVTVCPVVPVMLLLAALLEFAMLPVAVHVLAAHASVLKAPFVPHVAIPPPVYPSSHVTVTVCPVVPVMDPLVALLELAMLPAAVQVLAEHVKVLNWPFVPQVAAPPPVYPVLHVTVTVCAVVPA